MMAVSVVVVAVTQIPLAQSYSWNRSPYRFYSSRRETMLPSCIELCLYIFQGMLSSLMLTTVVIVFANCAFGLEPSEEHSSFSSMSLEALPSMQLLREMSLKDSTKETLEHICHTAVADNDSIS